MKVFFLLVGGLGAASMLLYAFVGQLAEKIKKAGRKPLLLLLGTALVTALIGLCLAFVSDNGFLNYWVLSALFFLAAIVYFRLGHRRFTSLEVEDMPKLLGAEALYTVAAALLAAALFTVGVYFLISRDYPLYPTLLSALFFLVPLLLYQTFQEAMTIPESVFPTWIYPSKPIELPEDNGNEKLLVIGFELAKKESDATRTFFRAKAPEDIALGELYYHFMNDYNELQSETPIRFADEGQQPYRWWFLLKGGKLGAMRILNPEATMRENNIRENSVIICERR